MREHVVDIRYDCSGKRSIVFLTLILAPACAVRNGPSTTSSQVITETSVRSHMEFLASDAMNGRGSGTRDEWIAATYIASQIKQWGLEPMGDDGGYVQTVAIERPELGGPPVLSLGVTVALLAAGVGYSLWKTRGAGLAGTPR